MIVILMSLLALCVLGLFFCFWGLDRNRKVAEFRMFIIDLNSRIEQKNIKAGGDFNGHLLFLKLPSYEKQLMSFKKLTIENYYDAKDQAILKSALEEKIKTECKTQSKDH